MAHLNCVYISEITYRLVDDRFDSCVWKELFPKTWKERKRNSFASKA